MTWTPNDEERAAIGELVRAARAMRSSREAVTRYTGPVNGETFRQLVDHRVSALLAIDNAADELLSIWGDHDLDNPETIRAGGPDGGQADGRGSGSDA